ncbi:MAG: glutamine synthetase III [Pseudobdellovibrionaceae bacterium]
MSQSSLGAQERYRAISEINNRTPKRFDPPRDESGKRLKISEFYGQNVFDLNKMKEKLPKDIFQKLQSTIQTGQKLSNDVANVVAQTVKEWSLSKGVTHYTHWFQPLTGLTAEKHDAFISPEGEQKVLEKFSGSQLVQSEPDASSFPSGGMRTTFEARGYAAWDPSSPMFIMEGPGTKTLCIPSVFIGYHGQALDEKTGLLRSIEALSKQACELFHLIGQKNIKRVVPTLGVEQEYFLIDRAFFSLRPDLIMSGRTLVGGQPPKGQQLEDHYFGSIPARVQAYMSETEHELYKLGVPIKTRHNEVAPSQFEAAPVFEEANIATDHNQVVMEVLKKVALRHNLQALLHEKPFAGINGSGKHNNWSMMISASDAEIDGDNLLEPGQTPHENIRFLLVLSAIMKGVHKHAGLLRASIASSGNDHRLGANEAPPAIISIFLGDLLTRICDDIESGRVTTAESPEKALMQLGVNKLPTVLRDTTDRNRTSPFAFTGNKFEFRAVGSSASTAFPVSLVNTAVADGFKDLIAKLKAKGVKGDLQSDSVVVLEVIRDIVKETKSIRFEGNGYSEEWVKEAEKRGLQNLRKSPEAIKELISASSIKVLTEHKVLSEEEVQSRFNVRIERYIKNLQIEVDCLKATVETQILPAAFSYYSTLSTGVAAAKAAGVDAPQLPVLKNLSGLINKAQDNLEKLKSATTAAEAIHDEYKKAEAYAYGVSESMLALRTLCDDLEATVSDEFWPLPKYREILFVS